MAIGWNEDCDRLTDHVICSVAEQALRSLVPAFNNAVEVFADDGVIRSFDDRDELPIDFLRPLAGGDIVEAVDRSRYVSSLIYLRSNIDYDNNPRPIGPLDKHFRVMHPVYLATEPSAIGHCSCGI